MKKLLMFIAIVLFSTGAIAQEPLFLSFEFMHVDEGQDSAYMETEKFWEKVHEQRVKNGDCIGWDLWRLQPAGQKQGAQYMTVSLFNDPVKMMEGGDYDKAWTGAYPDLSDEESAKKMEHTAKSRDITHRVFLYQVDTTTPEYDMPLGTLAVINFMKAKPGQAGAYEKMESEIFKANHQSQIAAGARASWGLLRNMQGYGTEAYASHITVDMYTGYDQFFNGGSDNDAAQTEAYEKALQDINATRDLKSMKMATLIRKVR